MEEHPGIRLLAANGRRAHDGFWKALRLYGWIVGHATAATLSRCRHIERFGITVCRLPSTSPIPTRHNKRMEDKVGEWKVVAQYAAGGPQGSGSRSENISSERVSSAAEVKGSKKEEAQG